MAGTSLTLFCLLDGEPMSMSFHVTIESSQTVSELQELIKSELSTLTALDGISMHLWRISIDCDNTDDHTAVMLNSIPNGKWLRSTLKLSSVFPKGLEEGKIHIMVQCVPSLKDKLDSLSAELDKVRTELKTFEGDRSELAARRKEWKKKPKKGRSARS